MLTVKRAVALCDAACLNQTGCAMHSDGCSAMLGELHKKACTTPAAGFHNTDGGIVYGKRLVCSSGYGHVLLKRCSISQCVRLHLWLRVCARVTVHLSRDTPSDVDGGVS